MRTFQDIVLKISLSFVNNGIEFKISDGIMRDFIYAAKVVTDARQICNPVERSQQATVLAYFLVGYLEALKRSEVVHEAAYIEATNILMQGIAGIEPTNNN